MACKQRGTYVEIRNKLHCASGRIAQNPLTSPLSLTSWRLQAGVGERCALPLPSSTYLATYLYIASPYPCTLSSFYQCVFSYTILFLPTALRRLPFAYSDITLSLSLTVTPPPTASSLTPILLSFSRRPTCPFFALFIPNWAFCAAPSEILSR